MRSISDEMKNTILEILPSEMTNAIYIYGSYGTKNFIPESSDLDIAWFTKTKVSLTTLYAFRKKLEDKLKINVDLKIPNEQYPFLLITEILSG